MMIIYQDKNFKNKMRLKYLKVNIEKKMKNSFYHI